MNIPVQSMFEFKKLAENKAVVASCYQNPDHSLVMIFEMKDKEGKEILLEMRMQNNPTEEQLALYKTHTSGKDQSTMTKAINNVTSKIHEGKSKKASTIK